MFKYFGRSGFESLYMLPLFQLLPEILKLAASAASLFDIATEKKRLMCRQQQGFANRSQDTKGAGATTQIPPRYCPEYFQTLTHLLTLSPGRYFGLSGTDVSGTMGLVQSFELRQEMKPGQAPHALLTKPIRSEPAINPEHKGRVLHSGSKVQEQRDSRKHGLWDHTLLRPVEPRDTPTNREFLLRTGNL